MIYYIFSSHIMPNSIFNEFSSKVNVGSIPEGLSVLPLGERDSGKKDLRDEPGRNFSWTAQSTIWFYFMHSVLVHWFLEHN